jgi:hypothetical protein
VQSAQIPQTLVLSTFTQCRPTEMKIFIPHSFLFSIKEERCAGAKSWERFFDALHDRLFDGSAMALLQKIAGKAKNNK